MESSIFALTSSVPQESVLDYLLFVSYINLMVKVEED